MKTLPIDVSSKTIVPFELYSPAGVVKDGTVGVGTGVGLGVGVKLGDGLLDRRSKHAA